MARLIEPIAHGAFVMDRDDVVVIRNSVRSLAFSTTSAYTQHMVAHRDVELLTSATPMTIPLTASGTLPVGGKQPNHVGLEDDKGIHTVDYVIDYVTERTISVTYTLREGRAINIPE